MRSSIKINNGTINTTGSINYGSGNKKLSSPEAYYDSLNSISSNLKILYPLLILMAVTQYQIH